LKPTHLVYGVLIVVGFALLYLVPGIVYWSQTQPDVAKCLWGEPACSLSVATFVLVFVTAGAFLAAFTAALYAYQTMVIARNALGLERSAILMIRQCRESHTCSLDILVGRDRIQHRGPSVTEEPYYCAMNYDFVSIGRTAVVKPTIPVHIRFVYRDTNKFQFAPLEQLVALDSLGVGDHVHTTIWVESEILNLTEVSWHEGRAMQAVQNKKMPLECHAALPQRPSLRIMLQWPESEDAAQEAACEEPREVSIPEPSTSPEASKE
jgi:hypothetical protein